MNSVSEPALKVSGDSAACHVSFCCGVEKIRKLFTNYMVCAVFYYLRKDQRCLHCLFPQVWVLSHDHDAQKAMT